MKMISVFWQLVVSKSSWLIVWRADVSSFDAGETIVEKDRCGQCKGQKVVQDKKLLEVHVEKGMQHGQKITFQGEADEAVRVF